MKKKAIGGYFELECGNRPLYHQDGEYLNSCRNGLRYLIRSLEITKLHVPIYTCSAVTDAIQREGCEIETYSLNEELLPNKEFLRTDFIVYNNYFGVIGKNVEHIVALYPNLILDNAQAFYSKQTGRASIYSPRKFFGLPDGGIIRGKDLPQLKLSRGVSWENCTHLLKRHDLGAEAGYVDFVSNDEILGNNPLEYMSSLTKSLMRNIDYDKVKFIRCANFQYLNERLKTEFPIEMSEQDVPMIFPLLRSDGKSLRNRLIDNKVFVATYWPNVLNQAEKDSWEHYIAENLIPLPVDQRYGKEEMEYIINICNG